MSTLPQRAGIDPSWRTTAERLSELAARLKYPGLLALTFTLLSVYTYGAFTRSLLLGFDGIWIGDAYRVEWAVPSVPLQPGDLLIQLGSIPLVEFAEDLRRSMLDEFRPGQTVTAVVIRNGQELTIAYTIPGYTDDEFRSRLFSQIWFGWWFWIFGLLTYMSIRPRDTRWRLLIAFFCVTAIWLSASTLSWLHLWESAIVLRMALWLSVPIYWHLHWVFPERLPALRRWPRLRAFGYGAAILLAALEWLQLLPTSLYIAGFGLAFLGLFIPLLVRAFSKTQARRARVLWWMLLLAVAPGIVLAVFAGLGGSTVIALVALLGLPLLPFGYFYTAYRPQLGWLELRANRLIALFLFGLMLAVGAALVVPVTMTRSTDPGAMYTVPVLGAVVLGVAAAIGFPFFQRWVERRLLNIPLPPRHLLGRFLAGITASLDRATLAHVLAADILPSLQITQSAMLYFAEDGSARWLYLRNTPGAELPDAADSQALLASAGRYRPLSEADSDTQAWVRLALRLVMEEKTIGLWLLGRRDPDDEYSQAMIDFLQVLADQAALAVTALRQTEQLRRAVQQDIDQRETERVQLARDLHDVVLNSLAGLRNSVGPNPPPGFLEAYNRAVTRLRETISGLRPPLLDYGLYPALKALAGDHDYRDEPLPSLTFTLPESTVRYEAKVEEHLYRIVQHAYENALQHANAGALTLGGVLSPGQLELWVEDDGAGLTPRGDHERKHFGLRGMQERAALIGAKLEVTVTPPHGTRVCVRWRTPDSDESSVTVE